MQAHTLQHTCVYMYIHLHIAIRVEIAIKKWGVHNSKTFDQLGSNYNHEV